MPGPGIVGELHGTAFDEQSLTPASQSIPESCGQPDRWAEIKANLSEQWQQLPIKEQAALVVDMMNVVLEAENGAECVRCVLEGRQLDEPSLPIAGELLPIAQVARLTGYSRARIHALLIEGRISGERRRQRGVWYTTLTEVENYRQTKPTPQDYGRKGAQRRWHSND